MVKLPKIITTSVPEHQKIRLMDWCRERQIDIKGREINDTEFIVTDNPVKNEDLEVNLKELISDYDNEIQVGQVRLLSPGIIPDRMAHVLIMSELASESEENKTFIVVPFGPYTTPATRTELAVDTENNHLKVLQCWLARTVRQEQMKESWTIESEFNADSMKQAKAVWRHATFGMGLPEELQEKVGAPIAHPKDPRILYQKEEMELWASVTSLN
jgi:hypothetical protein